MPHSNYLSLILSIFVLFSTPGVAQNNPKEPPGNGPWPVLMSYRDKADILAIREQHDFWKIDEKNQTVLMQIKNQKELQQLQQQGFQLNIHQQLYSEALKRQDKAWFGIKSIDGFACYRTVTETFTAMDDMESNYPDLVELVDIGDSWHKVNTGGHPGHDMQVVKITNKNNPVADKPILYAMGSIHAREYPPAELVTRFAEYLLTNYGQDADATWLVDEHEIHLLLQGNPDGREIAENQSFPDQRKNRNENHCFNGDQQGVDMNRNFGFYWNQGTGSSGQACSQVYRGTAAYSEPETDAIDRYIKNLFPDDRPDDLTTPAPLTKSGIYIDIHNVAELTMFPWGFADNTPEAPNHDQLQTLARRLSYFNGYRSQKSNELYGADGASDDNAYGTLGVAAFTIELGEGSFYSSCSSFNNTIWPDNLKALLYAAKVARQPYIMASGPSVEQLPLNPIEVAQGQNMSVQGLATDDNFYQQNGTEPTQNITTVQAYIDTPPWHSGALATSLAAQDGSFNSSSEYFTGTLPTAGLTPGRHMVWFTATDAEGITGVPSAVFIDVIDPALIGTLNGTVTDQADGLAIASANINFDNLIVSTDSNGYYEFQATARTADLIVSKAGYQLQTLPGVTITAQQSNTQNIVLQATCGDISNDLEAFNNLAEAEAAGWQTGANVGSDDWRLETGDDHSTGQGKALVSTDVNSLADKFIITPEVALIDNATLRFWHKHDFEAGNAYYDGGVLEISTDNGQNWSDLGSHITQNGYNGTLDGGYGQPLGARPAFVDSLGTFQQVVVDLSGFANQTVRVRWRMGTDSGVGAGDWLIDDIVVSGYRSCDNDDLIFANGFD